MARIRPSKGGQELGEPGPGGAEPPVPGKKKPKGSDDKRKPQARPRKASKTDKAGSVTKSVQEGRSRRFLGEVITELKKVTWPTRAKLMQATGVVVVFVAIVTIYLGVVDSLMSALVNAVF